MARPILVDKETCDSVSPATERLCDLEPEVDIDGTDLALAADRESAAVFPRLREMVKDDDRTAACAEWIDDDPIEALNVGTAVRVEFVKRESRRIAIDHDERWPPRFDQRDDIGSY